MALNIIWMGFFVIAFIIALCKLVFLGDTTIFKLLADGIFDSAKSSVIDVAFPLAGTMVFFLGLMNIAEKAGAIQKLAKWMNPFLSRLFPEVPANHPAMGQMVMNFSANMLGLDNAATPFGLKAMESLQSLNPEKEKATNAQIMFLVLHTSGLTIIPLTIISYRLAAGSQDAASIFIPCVLATIGTTLASILMVGFYQKLKWDKVLISWLIGLVLIMVGVLLGVNSLSSANKEIFSKVIGSGLLLVIIVAIIVGGAYKKVSVFDAFIEGAKNGFEVIIKIIPYLVAMLVAIRVFRDSGAMNYVLNAITYLIQLTGMNTEFIGALPVAIMKPLSGSGARGMMLDIFQNQGPDSFVGKLASIFQGSADTTFYIIALYFGSVGIKKIRYALWAGIFADIIGVVIAILIGYIFFK
ncbi:MAG: spore maturation protein [Chitinophagaceae bacterium]|jgi:spore maturation protein SpmA|nr:spore maturation protein [Chitinophagaceae bacterium]